jgi:IS605 OrfB family transposase
MKNIYPTLLESGNIINSHSWFDIIEHKNESYNKKRHKQNINVNYIDTIKIKLELNGKQKVVILKWMDDCIDIYNMTNEYLKSILTNINYKKELNFINLRRILNENIRIICKNNNLNKHAADYAVKHCMEMYKSAFSNHKDMSKFNVKNLDKNRRRKNLVVEPLSVSKKINSFFMRELQEIDSSLPLNIITMNSILQYDSYKKTFIIITPKEKNGDFKLKQRRKCGVDIGVRTFLTTYSTNASYEIGTNTNKQIDKINKRLDNINNSKDTKKISHGKYKKLNYKYRDKLDNLISDMHNKTANFLLSKYKTIIIGKVSTKKMVSNLTGNLHDIVKRRLMALSHYRFRMKLHSMSKKFGSTIIETDEYLTSKCCSNCKNIKDNLGSVKIYKCDKCNMILDRDINAAINIYKNRILSR